MHDLPQILSVAAAHTTGERQHDYGPPAVNLGERTAGLFSAYVRGMNDPTVWTATDVCNMMILLKIARLQEMPETPHFDSLVDIAGYASAAWEAHCD